MEETEPFLYVSHVSLYNHLALARSLLISYLATYLPIYIPAFNGHFPG